MVLLIALLGVLQSAAPSRRDLLWGGLAGLTGGVGVALLYRALAVGTMAVVAPTTAVCAVMIPVGFEALFEKPPSPLTTVGIALALVAIVLVSQPDGRPTAVSDATERRMLPSGIWLAFASGVAIGLFFLLLARTSSSAGLWPLVAARVVSVSLFAVIAVAGRQSLRLDVSNMRIAMSGGALDMLANALYVFATRYGSLSVVVTLSSLYPASTVVLARVVLGERLSRTQSAGVGCALGAIALIVGA